MTVTNNGKLAQWLDDFISVLSKKDAASEEQLKLAEINIHDLPKVVWNDETFYVIFDKAGATIINEFGNVVTTLQDAITIEDVDNKLNSKQVVTSVDPFEEELKKISNYLVADANDPNTPSDPDSSSPSPTIVTPSPETSAQPASDANNPVAVSNTDPTTASLKDEEDPIDTDDAGEIDDMSKEIESINNNLDILEKYSKLETMYSELYKKVEALTQQQYAHTDPGAIYDNNIADVEMQHVQEMMDASQQAMDKEHNTDLTTPAGRISLKDKLSNDINYIMDEEDTVDDNISNDNISNEDDKVETTEITEVNEENPSNEKPEGDELVEEELPELKLESPENSGASLPDVVDTFDTMNVETHDNIKDIRNEILNKDSDAIEKPVEENTEKSIKKENSLNNGVTVLSAKDAKLFKKQICPDCYESELVKDRTVGNMVGLYCKACNKEYAVNTDTEEIFRKN